MDIVRIAETRMVDLFDTPYTRHTGGFSGYKPVNEDPDELVEFAGRNCYQSWDRAHRATAANIDYIANVIDKGHLSLLEHAQVTYYVTGVSTALLGQFTRHRHLSFSVESARYVNKSTEDVTIPGPIRNSTELNAIAVDAVAHAYDAYEELVAKLLSEGFTNKQARQAARVVLPQGIHTKIVASGNLRAWREFLSKRLSSSADEEIHCLAQLILKDLKEYAPNCFADF